MLYEELSKITKCKKDYDIGSNSWIGTGGKADILLLPQNIDELKLSLQKCKEISHEASIHVIGARSNTIVRMGGVRGVTILLRNGFTNIEQIDNNTIRAGCGVPDLNLSNFAANNDIGGMEFLIGIPGTLGGNIRMNAGCYGSEMKDIIVSIEAIDFDGNIVHFDNSDVLFSYRKISLPKNIIFTSAILKGFASQSSSIFEKMNEISQKRKMTQPIGRKTVGSTFKNPKFFAKEAWDRIANYFNKSFDHSIQEDIILSSQVFSWMLIDACNLRGFSIGGAQSSEVHCNFLVNKGNATASDFEDLGEYIISKVYEKFRVKLEWEVDRIGDY